MFSGIVEGMGEVVSIHTDRQNKDFTLRADFCRELKIDQSIAHNGVCLTVVALTDDTYTVTAMKETLDRSNLGLLKVGDEVEVFGKRQRVDVLAAAAGTIPYELTCAVSKRVPRVYLQNGQVTERELLLRF